MDNDRERLQRLLDDAIAGFPPGYGLAGRQIIADVRPALTLQVGAMALPDEMPDGRVMIYVDHVALALDDQALLYVLAHELAHVALGHVRLFEDVATHYPAGLREIVEDACQDLADSLAFLYFSAEARALHGRAGSSRLLYAVMARVRGHSDYDQKKNDPGPTTGPASCGDCPVWKAAQALCPGCPNARADQDDPE